MAELKLFKLDGKVEELKSRSVTIEKELQYSRLYNFIYGRDAVFSRNYSAGSLCFEYHYKPE